LSMGQPAPEYKLRLLNDAGAPAEPGETGNLAIRGVRGLSLFAEYLDDPAATAAAFDKENFLLTGDRALRDQNGFFYFADRAKDMLSHHRRRRAEPHAQSRTPEVRGGWPNSDSPISGV